MIGEDDGVVVEEIGVLEKFEGEPLAENLVQRVWVKNGVITKIEDFDGGELVATREKGVE